MVVPLRHALLIILCSLSPSLPAGEVAACFLAGADLSHLPLMERRGHVFRDRGQDRDALTLLAAHGLNCVRLRLWTSSEAEAVSDPYSRGNTLAATVAMARRVKAAGLQLLLDLHYSDSWADPGHQAKPRAWEGLSFPELEQRMYTYSRDVIATLRDADVLPEYVQIGNETPMGLVWPEGKVDAPEKWSQLARLIRAADRGITEAGGVRKPKTIIHLDRGGDWATTAWFFDRLIRVEGVQFDIIGQSYYPFYHGPLADLRTCLRGCVERYGKPVIIAETGFPWSATEWDGTPVAPLAGIAAGSDGQVRFVTELGRILAELPQGKGLGIFWWGAEFQATPGLNLAGFEKRSFWGHDSGVLPVVDALGALAAPPHGLSPPP